MKGLVFYDSDGEIVANHVDGKGWVLVGEDGKIKSDNFMSRESNIYFDSQRIEGKEMAIDVINMLMLRFCININEL